MRGGGGGGPASAESSGAAVLLLRACCPPPGVCALPQRCSRPYIPLECSCLALNCSHTRHRPLSRAPRPPRPTAAAFCSRPRGPAPAAAALPPAAACADPAAADRHAGALLPGHSMRRVAGAAAAARGALGDRVSARVMACRQTPFLAAWRQPVPAPPPPPPPNPPLLHTTAWPAPRPRCCSSPRCCSAGMRASAGRCSWATRPSTSRTRRRQWQSAAP
jgi:hypothetical protein